MSHTEAPAVVAGTSAQAESSKPAARQAVPWFEPLSRYFQFDPVGMNVTAVLVPEDCVVALAVLVLPESPPELLAWTR